MPVPEVFLRRAALITTILAFSALVQAQRVGVVLGGGGAKGMSHIGVLKALEENHIPIHYIAGTSIGAIVGGLYASGYSPAEIEAIALSGKFEEWASGIIPDELYSYYLLDDPNPALGNFRFDYDTSWRMVLPSSLRSPVIMDFVVQQYFAQANVASQNNFDQLMIPFRCVAADIGNSRALVLRDGDLGRAIRASMTFPFVFRPIRIDGKLLYDGGMYNNFPSDVMYHEFFPDIIIGAKAADNYDPPTDDNIISHLQNMLMENTDFDVICENSILIQPNLRPYHVLRFANPKGIIDSGYVETLRHIEEIRLFVHDSVSPDSAAAMRARFREKAPPLLIDRVYITGLNHQQFKFVNNFLKGNLRAGKDRYKPIPVEEVKQEYLKLAALDLFSKTIPTIDLDSNSRYYYLHLDMARKANFTANFGGLISTSPINEGFVELKYQFLRRNIHTASVNTHFGRFYNSIRIQDRLDFPLEQNLYLLAAFTVNHWNYFKSASAFIEDNTPAYLLERDRHFRFLLGKGVGSKGKAEIDFAMGSLVVEYFNSSDYRSKDTLDRTAFVFRSPGLKLDFNNLNRTYYASAGERFQFKVRHVAGKEYHRPGSTSVFTENSEQNQSWFTVITSYEAYHTVNPVWSLGFAIESSFSNQKPFNNYTASVLYAPVWAPVPEAATLFMPQIRAFSYFALGGRAILHTRNRVDVRFEAHMFSPYRELVPSENQQAIVKGNYQKIHGISSIIAVYHSPLGPVSFHFNYYHRSPAPLHAGISFGYILFNRKAWF